MTKDDSVIDILARTVDTIGSGIDTIGSAIADAVADIVEPVAKKKVLIGMPSHGVSPPRAMAYREAMAFRMGRWSLEPECPFEFGQVIMPDMLVQYSREEICDQAVKGGFDYVGMIDDDMIGPMDLWPRLLALDVDIVAPLAFTRQKPHNPVVYGTRGGWLIDSPHHALHTHVIRNYPKDTLFECAAVGFGAVLIKVDVLKRMEKPWFFTMWGTKGTGEDIFFCIMAARHAGAKVYCDARLKLGHLGPELYVGEEDYERCNPEIKELREVTGPWTKEKASQNLLA